MERLSLKKQVGINFCMRKEQKKTKVISITGLPAKITINFSILNCQEGTKHPIHHGKPKDR